MAEDMAEDMALVGTKLVLGYEDGTSETFHLTLTLEQSREHYHTLLTTGSEDSETCFCGSFICIETPQAVHYRRHGDIDQVSMSRHTLVDASKTRKRRSPRKPAAKRTTTAPAKGQTKKA